MAREDYSFEHTDEVATSDAAFEATGTNLSRLFNSCGAALFDVMVDLENIEPAEEQAVRLSADDIEGLLYEWLSQLVYLKDVERKLYSRFNVTVSEGQDGCKLEGSIAGEAFDNVRHEARADIKAVTYYRLKIEKTDAGYRAFVVLDL
jgi:SHS2 domain-containing protein